MVQKGKYGFWPNSRAYSNLAKINEGGEDKMNPQLIFLSNQGELCLYDFPVMMREFAEIMYKYIYIYINYSQIRPIKKLSLRHYISAINKFQNTQQRWGL